VPVSRTLFSGSPYLGVFFRAGETSVVIPPSTPGGLERDLVRLLGVRPVRTTVHDSEIVGALVAGNANGVVVGDELDPVEASQLASVAPVTVVRVRQNALGNNVLVNDHGAVVHPEFSDETIARLGRALKVPIRRGTIAGLGTVGMAGITTNRGVVVHPKVTEPESRRIEETLAVPVHRSTANFGVPIVGACLIANSRGFVAGKPTTSVELAHLQEGLQIFD